MRKDESMWELNLESAWWTLIEVWEKCQKSFWGSSFSTYEKYSDFCQKFELLKNLNGYFGLKTSLQFIKFHLIFWFFRRMWLSLIYWWDPGSFKSWHLSLGFKIFRQKIIFSFLDLFLEKKWRDHFALEKFFLTWVKILFCWVKQFFLL